MTGVDEARKDRSTHQLLLRVTFYAAIIVASVGGLGMCIIAIPGHNWATYTVVNDTGTDLLTWVIDRPCDELVGRKGDYAPQERVPANGVLDYVHISDADGCIQVVTEDRRLVLAEPYAYGAVVLVMEPLIYQSNPLPAEDDLDGSYFWHVLIKPDRTLLIIYVALPLLVLGGGVAWWSQRRLRKIGIRV